MDQVFYCQIKQEKEIETESLLQEFADIIKDKFQRLEGYEEYTGIYLASSNAGVTEAVRFWGSAVEKGPGFVFPQQFPLTLSNYPCGFFSRFLGIHGPCFTLMGDGEALIGAFDHAMMDLSAKVISYALIIAIDFAWQEEPVNQLTFSIIHSNNNALKLKNELVKRFQESGQPVNPSELFKNCCGGMEISRNTSKQDLIKPE